MAEAEAIQATEEPIESGRGPLTCLLLRIEVHLPIWTPPLLIGDPIRGGRSTWPIPAKQQVDSYPIAASPFRASQTIVSGSYHHVGSLPRASPPPHDERKHIVHHGAVDSDLE